MSGRLGDAIAGVTVASVLLPQSLAYAELAGVPPNNGIVLAAVAPLAAAFFASSPFLQTGPTAVTSLLVFAGLSVLASPGTARYAGLAALLALVVGVTRLLLGLFRAGAVAYLMSQPVVAGFTSAAGVLIIASQIPTALGVSSAFENPILAAGAAIRDVSVWDMEAIIVTVAVTALVLLGRRVHPLTPVALVAVAASTLYSAIFSYGGAIVGKLSPDFSVTTSLPWGSLSLILIPGAVIAIMGFAEPASIARRYATQDRKLWDPHRELISQGIANVAAGFTGGFPVGGSFSRSALNRLSGAQSRWSGAITGLVVLACLPFASVISRLPQATLAAIVIVAAAELIRVRPFLRFRRYARLQSDVSIATFALTLLLAPHIERAVIIGVALAIATHLWRELQLSIPAWVDDDVLHLQPRGVLYFASAPGLERAFSHLLNEHPDVSGLRIHLDGLGRVDLTGALALKSLREEAEEGGLAVEFFDVPPQAKKIISRVFEQEKPSEETEPDSMGADNE